jgi:hypothetical protein
MSRVHFQIHVVRPVSEQATATLDALRLELGRTNPLAPDEYGTVHLLLDGPIADDAYNEMTRLLAEIDPRWEDYIHIKNPST